MFCNYIAGKPTNQDQVVVNENSETYTSVTVCSNYCTILRSRKESPRPRQHSAPFCQKFSRGLFEKESVDSRHATVGGGMLFSSYFFCSGSGSRARVTPPPFLAVIGFFRAALFCRYESFMRWLPTLRHTNHPACFGQWGTESLVCEYDGMVANTRQ